MSGLTVHSNRQRGADLTHSFAVETTQPIRERADRNALYRVEVDGRSQRDRVLPGFKHNLAGKPSNVRGAGSNHGTPKSGNGSIARQHDNRATRCLRQLAPPDFASLR